MLGHFKALSKDSEIHRHHRNLPHWQQPDCTYFITFRLADSLPRDQLDVWTREKELWLRSHPEPWSAQVHHEYHLLFTERIQAWLDNGYEACLLRNPEAAAITETAFKHFGMQRYALDAYVIMPNHAHALIQPAEDCTLPDILHSWKSYSAHVINKILSRRGTLWMDEYFDHAVRSWEQMEYYRRYILDNPAKAGLKTGFVVGLGRGIRLAP